MSTEERLAMALYEHGGWPEKWSDAPLARRGYWHAYARTALDHLRRSGLLVDEANRG